MNNTQNKGITLIALIITIIVLLILATISINSLVGENGIITRASKTKELYNIEMGRERVEIVLSEYDVERLADKLLQDIDRLDGMYNDGKKDWVRKTKDKTENSLIVVDDNNNMYKVTIGEDGKTEVEYIGKDNGEPWPELTLSIRTETEENNLEAYIQVEASENKNGIKSIELIQTGETKTYNGQKTVTDEFKVMQNGIYKVKVTSTKEKVTTKQIEVNVVTILSFSEVEWIEGKARVKIESGQTLDTIRYKIMEKSEYETYTEGTYISNLEHEDTVIAQLWNGQAGYGTASIKIQDKQAPEITVNTSNTTNSITAVVTNAIDKEWGMPSSPTYIYYIKETSQTEGSYIEKQRGVDNTCEIEGLRQNESYDIKVQVADKAGNVAETKKTVVTGEIPGGDIQTGTISFGNITWENSKARVQISTNQSDYYIEYQVGGIEGTWTRGSTKGQTVTASQIEHNETIYARLTDGTNYGEYASLQILDTQLPQNATISLSSTNVTSGTNITGTITHIDYESGVNVLSCKWMYNKSAREIGTDERNYTGGTFSSNGETITLNNSTAGTYYLHVLTQDFAGNLKETISIAVTVHTHAYKWARMDETSHKGTCSCGDIITETHAAYWGDYVQVRNAECERAGLQVSTCARCNDTRTQSLPVATGHSKYSFTPNAWCSSDPVYNGCGYSYGTWTRCRNCDLRMVSKMRQRLVVSIVMDFSLTGDCKRRMNLSKVYNKTVQKFANGIEQICIVFSMSFLGIISQFFLEEMW